LAFQETECRSNFEVDEMIGRHVERRAEREELLDNRTVHSLTPVGFP
jgi:hypothetical protein